MVSNVSNVSILVLELPCMVVQIYCLLFCVKFFRGPCLDEVKGHDSNFPPLPSSRSCHPWLQNPSPKLSSPAGRARDAGQE